MSDLPPYVSRERNRHGTERIYYRKNGRRIRLLTEPGTDAFLDECKAAAAAMKKHPDYLAEAPAGSFVYFVLLGNAKVKIGTARDPKNRLKAFRAGIPGKARLYYVTPGGRHLERALHKQFASDRVSGEWFLYSQQIREWIAIDERERLQARRA